MNCKPGDLARVVAPYWAPGRGAFVIVKRAAALGIYAAFGREWDVDAPSWVVDGWVRAESGLKGPQLIVADSCLRKVDAESSTDEALTRKPIEEPQCQS